MPRTHTFPILCCWTNGQWTEENYDFPELPDGKEPTKDQVLAKIEERLGENSPYQLADFILTPAIDDEFADEDFWYPHGEKYPLAPTARGLYLKLWNGRRDYVPCDELGDCGFDGPVIGPVYNVQTTYGAEIKMEAEPGFSISHFFPPDHEPRLRGETMHILFIDGDGYIEHDGCCYGDWSIYYHNGES